MTSRVDVSVAETLPSTFNGAGTHYIVQIPSGVLYVFYVDETNDPVFKKSLDGGFSWSDATVIFVGTVTALSVWYDKWSGLSGGLIHCAYTESGGDDILYRSVDTENSDALGTQTTVFAGGTTLAGGALSISRARGGNLVVAGSIDAGTEDGAWESTDVGATWGSAIADPSEGATDDQYLLLPGWNADTQDVMLIFWDASNDELSVKRYDDSGDSWAETSIATGMVDRTAANDFPHFAACVDLANSRNIIVAWSDIDVANADLRCWIINDTTITETSTNVVLNSTDDQGFAAISIDTVTGLWTVIYAGKSDGSETFKTAINLYYKTSSDAGATWSAEIPANSLVRGATTISWVVTVPRNYHYSVLPPVAYMRDLANNDVVVAVTLPMQPRAQYQR